MPVEFYPRVDIPVLTVVTIFPGAGPQEIETLVTKPLEDAVAAVNHIKNISSSSQENVSILGIEFDLGTDLETAAADVREKIELAKSFSELSDSARDVLIDKVAHLAQEAKIEYFKEI